MAFRARLLRQMQDAGVGILLGADSPQILNVPGIATHQELAAVVKAGLTPYEALVSGTRNVASVLRHREGRGNGGAPA